MIFKNLWRRKTRTLLTMLGIAIGVAAVVALGAVAAGIVDSYASILSNPNTDITVSQKDAIDISFSALDEDLLPRLQAVPGVEVVDPVVVGFVQSENLPFFIVFGYESELAGDPPLQGRRRTSRSQRRARSCSEHRRPPS